MEENLCVCQAIPISDQKRNVADKSCVPKDNGDVVGSHDDVDDDDHDDNDNQDAMTIFHFLGLGKY